MSTYWVRPALPGDGPKVRDLARRVVREFRLARRWSDPPAGESETDHMWVVEAGRGEVVGSCGLRETSAGVWELHSLYLAPEFRGFGIGRSLVENAIRVARAHGGLKVVFCSPVEFHEAHGLMKRLGFVVAGGEAGVAGTSRPAGHAKPGRRGRAIEHASEAGAETSFELPLSGLA